jgi:hypothetical protein
MLAHAMGPATFADLPDGSVWSLKTITPSPSRCDKCQHETPNAAYRKPHYKAPKSTP